MPRAQKGQRFGGRKAGTPNKKTVLAASVRQALEQEGCDPAVVLAQIALGRIVSGAEVRTRAAAELLQYVAPKLNRTEVTGLDGGKLQMELFGSAGERIAGRLDSLAAEAAGEAA